MALAGFQTIHLVATPAGNNPIGQSPYPPTTPITVSDPFPQSPSPAFALLTQIVQSVSAPTAKQLVDYPKAGSVINVTYFMGNERQTDSIIAQEAAATVIAAL